MTAAALPFLLLCPSARALAPLTPSQKDRELQESLRQLSISPTAAAAAAPPRVRDPTVRNWFAVNGVPLDAAGSLEM